MNRRERRAARRPRPATGPQPLPSPADLQGLLQAALEAHRSGDLARAEAGYRQILSKAPAHVDALHLLGTLHLQRGELTVAEALIRNALAHRLGLPAAHNNLGAALRGQCRFEEAAECYRQAIALQPDYADAHSNLGVALQSLGRLEDAGASFRRALAIAPRHGEARKNLGTALHEQGKLDEAEACYRHALSLNPRDADALSNLGVAFHDQGKAEEAVACFRQALALRPGLTSAQDNLLYALNDCARMSAADIYAAHKAWGDSQPRGAALARPYSAASLEAPRRLRIGYVSPDFRTHSVAFFFEPLLAAHDHDAFEIVCYANMAREDATTARLKAAADRWRSIAALPDAAAAEQIRRDGIDILVDLAGHTVGNRLGVFALKPAPLQATWLGYPNTTGLPAIDYRITDAVADPVGEADLLHSEKLVRLPRSFLCYQPPAASPPVGPLPAARAGHVTYGSFNNIRKLTEDVVRRWARVLHAVPGSRLLLKAKQLGDGPTRARYLSLFAAEGVEAGRLELVGAVSAMADHLGLYGRVDIALDPFPYNGTTTTCDALWMGVPVVTLRGDRHGARVGASLLTTVGFPELIAEGPDDYVARAAGLARNLDRLADMRHCLRDRVRGSALGDGERFAREMESAFRALWHRRQMAPREPESVPRSPAFAP